MFPAQGLSTINCIVAYDSGVYRAPERLKYSMKLFAIIFPSMIRYQPIRRGRPAQTFTCSILNFASDVKYFKLFPRGSVGAKALCYKPGGPGCETR
jgi:hypothetical protein